MANRKPWNMGECVREEREALGLTQGQLGERCGYDQRTISKIERSAQLGATKMVELAKALNINPEYLRAGRGPKRPGASADAMRWTAIARLPEEHQRTIRAYLDVQMPGWDDNDGNGPRTDINIPKEGK